MARLLERKDHSGDGSSEKGSENTDQESTLSLFVKYPRAQGRWNAAQAKVHIAAGAAGTLCRKNCRPDAPGDGAISARGWRFLSGRRLREVTCASCLEALDRAAVRACASAEASPHGNTPAARMARPLACLETAASLRQAHRCLAQACAPDLTDQEIATYRQYGFFSPQQCLRLLQLVRDQGFAVPAAALGLEERPTSALPPHEDGRGR